MKPKTRTSAILALLLLLPLTALADSVDDYVRSFMSERHIPGAAVAVIDKGKVAKMQGYGVASLEFNVPVTTETVFEIGSVSKQMTAAAIMLLVEDGKVRLDEKISAYLPDTPEAWRDLTVRHLLTHSSGIRNYSSLDGFALLRRLKVADFIKQLSPHPLDFPPGEQNAYSNSGFNLLAFIIESRSGKPYIEFMRERIFRPLGMTRTGDRDPEYVIPNRASGYEWRGSRHAGRNWDLTDLMGAGSIVSTIGDMVKWNTALDGDIFLKPSSKAEIWKQFVFTNGKPSVYGFGWRISDIRGHKLTGHTGQTAGFTAANFRYPDHGLTVVVLTNTGETGNAGLMATRIAKFYIPSMSLRAVKQKPEAVAGLGEKLLTALRARNEDRLDTVPLAPQLFRSLSTDRAKATYRRIAALGNPANAMFVESDETGSRPSFRYRVDAGKRIFLWRVSIDDVGKLTELSLEEEE
jgi:CubicO group peptidase (beta-lactamase class C family)